MVVVLNDPFFAPLFVRKVGFRFDWPPGVAYRATTWIIYGNEQIFIVLHQPFHRLVDPWIFTSDAYLERFLKGILRGCPCSLLYPRSRLVFTTAEVRTNVLLIFLFRLSRLIRFVNCRTACFFPYHFFIPFANASTAHDPFVPRRSSQFADYLQVALNIFNRPITVTRCSSIGKTFGRKCFWQK